MLWWQPGATHRSLFWSTMCTSQASPSGMGVPVRHGSWPRTGQQGRPTGHCQPLRGLTPVPGRSSFGRARVHGRSAKAGHSCSSLLRESFVPSFLRCHNGGLGFLTGTSMCKGAALGSGVMTPVAPGGTAQGSTTLARGTAWGWRRGCDGMERKYATGLLATLRAFPCAAQACGHAFGAA